MSTESIYMYIGNAIKILLEVRFGYKLAQIRLEKSGFL